MIIFLYLEDVSLFEAIVSVGTYTVADFLDYEVLVKLQVVGNGHI